MSISVLEMYELLGYDLGIHILYVHIYICMNICMQATVPKLSTGTNKKAAFSEDCLNLIVHPSGVGCTSPAVLGANKVLPKFRQESFDHYEQTAI
jgi:hypothetical protein